MAKPDNWTALSRDDQYCLATNLWSSMHGQYLIGQALAEAISIMRQRSHQYLELSNIEDMEMLGETLFSIGYTITTNNALKRQALAALQPEEDHP
jgi:hypothetical protein